MPKRILIIGILFCSGGAFAIWEVVSDLFRSHINLNFAVLMLPVGVGIMKGKKSSQWWGRFWIILGYLGCIIVVGASLISPQNVTATGFGEEINGTEAVPYVLIGALIFAILFVTIHRLLYSDIAHAYFCRESEPDDADNPVKSPENPRNQPDE